jgi:hypothetical protein
MLIAVGIPVIDGKPCFQTVDSLLAEQLLGCGQGVHLYPIWEVGCSLIGVARNRIAKRFLDSKCDCLVFVDSDISWKGGELARLAKRPEDVVGATYRAKTEKVRFHVRGDPEKQGDLYKVEGLPGGFLKVSRHALETMKAQPYIDSFGHEMRDWFPAGIIDGRYFGEDYGFCKLWSDSGGTVFLDPSIILRHHGGFQAYSGDPIAFLESL